MTAQPSRRSSRSLKACTTRSISCRETDKESQPFGDKSAVTIKAHHVEKLMEARADKPESANGLRKVLREMKSGGSIWEWRDDD